MGGGGGGPQFGQWNARQNWGKPGNSIPTGTAIFQDHTPTSVTISLTDQHRNPPTNIGTIQFDAGALAYSFTNNTTFNVTSSGIVNNSANQQTFINSSLLNFLNSSTAGNILPSTIIHTTNGGLTSFFGSSTGRLARFITDSGGRVDISTLTSAGMTSGSIEGAGIYSLGSKQLTTGLNNLSTVVSGVIADGGAAGGTGGSLIKVGTGTLTLSGANTYTGNTEVNGGTLLVNGSLGPGSVNVSSGAALGGAGTHRRSGDHSKRRVEQMPIAQNEGGLASLGWLLGFAKLKIPAPATRSRKAHCVVPDEQAQGLDVMSVLPLFLTGEIFSLFDRLVTARPPRDIARNQSPGVNRRTRPGVCAARLLAPDRLASGSEAKLFAT